MNLLYRVVHSLSRIFGLNSTIVRLTGPPSEKALRSRTGNSSTGKILLGIVRYFRGAYFGRGGLRKDGFLGFAVALVTAFDIAILELKMWEKYEKQRLRVNGQIPNHPNVG